MAAPWSRFACLSLLAVAALSALLLGSVAVRAQNSSFATGADLSALPYYESRGVTYSDGGTPADLLTITKRNGWQVVRVRLWVHPGADPKNAVSSLANVTALGKRIKAHGLAFLLDIHYSDTWADPSHQTKPAAWAALPFPKLVQTVHDYSRDVVEHLHRSGAMPDYVQVGNETKNGLLYGSGVDGSGAALGGDFWEPDKAGMSRAASLLAAGLAGVRDGSLPGHSPLTILHVPDGQDTGFVKWYFAALPEAARAAHVALSYDVIGLSYYPGTPWDRKAGYEPWRLTHLSDTMTYIAANLHKPLMIVETNWPSAGGDPALPGTPEFPLTPAGQAEFYRALLAAVRAVPNHSGRGVIAWEPDTLNWDSVFDAHGKALPAVRVLGGK